MKKLGILLISLTFLFSCEVYEIESQISHGVIRVDTGWTFVTRIASIDVVHIVHGYDKEKFFWKRVEGWDYIQDEKVSGKLGIGYVNGKLEHLELDGPTYFKRVFNPDSKFERIKVTGVSKFMYYTTQ